MGFHILGLIIGITGLVGCVWFLIALIKDKTAGFGERGIFAIPATFCGIYFILLINESVRRLF